MQQGQGYELAEQTGGLDAGRDQDQEGVEQGQAAVHDLEQLVEDHRQRDAGEDHDDVRGDAGPVQQLVGLEVGCGGRRVGGEHGGAHEADREGAADNVDQVQCAGDPRQLTRRGAR